MKNFWYHNPTKLIFGKEQIVALKEEIQKYGKNVLLVYGGGSIKRNGLHDQAITQLNEIGATVIELDGIEPNPRLTTAQKGADLCKKHNIDIILAVGGGSVIDCAKLISVGAKYDGDAWDIVTGKYRPVDALPLGTVLTLAATGTEMNANSVITNWETNEKLGWANALVYPKFSILDPTYTFSVPKDHTMYGIVDMMCHVMEGYFHRSPNTPLQDNYCEALLRTIIEVGPKLLADLENYELRETILYCGTMALNGSLSMGISGDWSCHMIEHAISAIHDIPHGGGLAIIYPNWMKYIAPVYPERFARFATEVFGINSVGKETLDVAYEGINALRTFWNSIGAPSTLADYRIDDTTIEAMSDRAPGGFGAIKILTREDVVAIYQESL